MADLALRETTTHCVLIIHIFSGAVGHPLSMVNAHGCTPRGMPAVVTGQRQEVDGRALEILPKGARMTKSMKKIAVLNQKGGVGKTTTAVNLSAALAEAGHRVCLMDLDPQAHASLHVGRTALEQGPNMYEVLCGRASLAEARQQVSECLSIVPAHLDLAAAEMELAGEVGREMILRDKLAADSAQFDYVIIDCPPSLGVLTLNALVAVDDVYLPLQPHFLALHGLSKLLRTIEIVSRRLNERLKLGGVIVCMYEAQTRLANEVMFDVEEFLSGQQSASNFLKHARIFRTRIRRNIRLAEAPSFGKTIFQYAPQSNGADDYRRLAEEVQLSHADWLAQADGASTDLPVQAKTEPLAA